MRCKAYMTRRSKQGRGALDFQLRDQPIPSVLRGVVEGKVTECLIPWMGYSGLHSKNFPKVRTVVAKERGV